MVLTVPPIRSRMGYKPAERVPTSYPGGFFLSPRLAKLIRMVVPNRPRRTVEGYEDP
jgi:hypothetical protein